jgi:hypothetical protein
MAEKYDPLPDLGALVHAALWGRSDVTAIADRVEEQLGLGEDDSPETVAAVLREALSMSASGPTVIGPHDEGSSYCTSLPLHDHDRPGETCPAYRADDNGDRWPCIRPPVHNYPDGVAERVHIDQFGTEFRVARCQDPAVHGMPHCWCAVPEHHKPLEPEPVPGAARTYLLGCGCQVTPAYGAAVGGPYFCAVHGDTTVTMAIPLPAGTPEASS